MQKREVEDGVIEEDEDMSERKLAKQDAEVPAPSPNSGLPALLQHTQVLKAEEGQELDKQDMKEKHRDKDEVH